MQTGKYTKEMLGIALGMAVVVAPMRAESAKPETFMAGAARVDITPKDLKNLNPIGGTSMLSVHDPIYARAVVMENGQQAAAVVALDLIETGDTTKVRKRIESELGIPAEHIFISASHDHSAPRAGKVTPGALAHDGGPEVMAYTDQLNDRIVEAVRKAKQSEQKARFGVGQGYADLNVNRDQYFGAGKDQGWNLGYSPERQSTKTVWVVRLENEQGAPIALLFNYAVHSTVTIGTWIVSGDLAGAAERYIEKRYQDKVVALYSMGPAGDQTPRESADLPPLFTKFTKEQEEDAFTMSDALGTVLGAEVVRVGNQIHSTTDAVHLSASERIVNCPTKKGKDVMEDMKQSAADNVPLHLGVLRLNDLALTSVSGEIVTNLYRRLVQESPLKDTILMTIVNDRVGYITDDAAYDTPYFEVNGNPAARGCAESAIVHGLVEMIQENK